MHDPFCYSLKTMLHEDTHQISQHRTASVEWLIGLVALYVRVGLMAMVDIRGIGGTASGVGRPGSVEHRQLR